MRRLSEVLWFHLTAFFISCLAKRHLAQRTRYPAAALVTPLLSSFTVPHQISLFFFQAFSGGKVLEAVYFQTHPAAAGTTATSPPETDFRYLFGLLRSVSCLCSSISCEKPLPAAAHLQDISAPPSPNITNHTSSCTDLEERKK